jgi:stage III sporulation protein AD
MEVLLKVSGLVLISACAVLMIRRSNPEIAFAVGLCTVIVILTLSFPLLKPVAELKETVRSLYGIGDSYLLPVIKCCAVAFTARVTADLCREAAQSAAASAIEFTGVLCAIAAAMPLLRMMLDTIGEML